MSLSFRIRALITGLSFGAGLHVVTHPALAQQSPAAPPASAETGRVANPELVRLEAFFEKEVREKVEAPYQAAAQKLTEVYRAALESAFKKAAAAGLLDETLALQNEAKRFAENISVPETDDAGTNAEVVRLRDFWRTETARFTKQRAATLRPVVEAHLGRLRLLERELTRTLKLDDAKTVRARRDSLAAQTPASDAPPAKPVASIPPASPAPTISGRPANRVDLYATGCNYCVVYVNGEQVMTVTRDTAEMKRVTLREGHIIAIKLPDRSSDNSFWLSAISSKGEFLFETSEKWMSYLPADPDKWWQIKDLKLQQPAEPAVEGQEYISLVKKSATGTPHYRGTQPIHTPLKAGGYMAYLYYVVTKEDLVPKKVQ